MEAKISTEHISIQLSADTAGAAYTLSYYHFIPDRKGEYSKIFLQAGLHADEQPGTLILHYLLDLLEQADKSGQLNAEFMVFPMVNPIGMAQIFNHHHSGRFDFLTGLNFNRNWPDLAECILNNEPEILGKLNENEQENKNKILSSVRRWIANQAPITALEKLRLETMKVAIECDVVLDLHCDVDATNHIYIVPQLMPEYQDLANWMGSRVTLTAENSGGGSFDEVWPRLWIDLQRLCPDKPIPSPVLSATLEYRGLIDVEEKLNKVDADNLMRFFIARGFVNSKIDIAMSKMPPALPFNATQIIKAELSGLVCYNVTLGQIVEEGELIANILLLDGPNAFRKKVPVYAETSGIVFSMKLQKYIWKGEPLAKIAGSKPLSNRKGALLEA